MATTQDHPPSLSKLYTTVEHYVARRVAHHDSARDITQEVFLGFAQAIDDNMAIDNLPGWLMRLAQHRVVDHYRKRQREHRQLDDSDFDNVATEEPHHASTKNCLDHCLLRYLNELPHDQAQARLLAQPQPSRTRQAIGSVCT